MYSWGGEEVWVVGGGAVLEFLNEAVEGVGAVEACATAWRRHRGAMDDEVAERREVHPREDEAEFLMEDVVGKSGMEAHSGAVGVEDEGGVAGHAQQTHWIVVGADMDATKIHADGAAEGFGVAGIGAEYGDIAIVG